MISRFTNIVVLIYLLSISVFAQTVTVKIIETSDVHGAIFPYSLKDNKEISVIGFITEEKEGSVIITRAGNKHQLIAQGWNHAIPK